MTKYQENHPVGVKLSVLCAFVFFILRIVETYRPLPSTVVLPPEKAEGCESYLQYLHAEDGEREAAREGSKSNGKKRISLNVKPRRLGALQC